MTLRVVTVALPKGQIGYDIFAVTPSGSVAKICTIDMAGDHSVRQSILGEVVSMIARNKVRDTAEGYQHVVDIASACGASPLEDVHVERHARRYDET